VKYRLLIKNTLGKIDIIANINWIAINIRGAYIPNSNSSSLILVGLRSNLSTYPNFKNKRRTTITIAVNI